MSRPHSCACGFFFTGFIYERQPVGSERCGALGEDDVEEFLLQFLGDRSAFAGADRDAVNRTDRRDLGRGASEENFVGEIERCTLDLCLDDLKAELACDLQNRITRDPGQYRRAERRRDQLAVIDEEYVLARAFGNHPAVVEGDAFGKSAEYG